jgi:Transposase DDE domain
VARRDFKRSENRPEEWLLIEWPKGEKEPTKYWLSTLPEGTTLHRLVYFAKLRWRIERDYQELKQEVGLGHFEGRGWRGFHHHATLCIAAYGFLISERERIPPSGVRLAGSFSQAPIPRGYRPTGSTVTTGTAHAKFNCYHAPTVGRSSRHRPAKMSPLHGFELSAETFVTQ